MSLFEEGTTIHYLVFELRDVHHSESDELRDDVLRCSISFYVLKLICFVNKNLHIEFIPFPLFILFNIFKISNYP